MPENNREDLVKYRLESAEERLQSAKILLDAKSLKDSVGRSYYSMFTAVRALLARDGVDFSKHAGVISYFQKEYVKTGKFDTPAKAQELVKEWLAANQTELLKMWDTQKIEKLPPL